METFFYSHARWQILTVLPSLFGMYTIVAVYELVHNVVNLFIKDIFQSSKIFSKVVLAFYEKIFSSDRERNLNLRPRIVKET